MRIYYSFVRIFLCLCTRITFEWMYRFSYGFVFVFVKKRTFWWWSHIYFIRIQHGYLSDCHFFYFSTFKSQISAKIGQSPWNLNMLLRLHSIIMCILSHNVHNRRIVFYFNRGASKNFNIGSSKWVLLATTELKRNMDKNKVLRQITIWFNKTL